MSNASQPSACLQLEPEEASRLSSLTQKPELPVGAGSEAPAGPYVDKPVSGGLPAEPAAPGQAQTAGSFPLQG